MCDAFLVLAQAPGGLSCFLVPAGAARRRPQPLPPPAAEGQARQPLQRLGRGRVRRRRRPGWSARRAGAWRPSWRWSTTPAWTAWSARRAPMQPGAVAQATHHAAHRSAFGRRLVDQPLMQQRAGRPAPWSRGGHHGGHAGGRRRTTRRRGRPGRGRPAAAGHGGRQVLGVQARAAAWPPRRWSAWAATATSRSRGCPGCSARRPLNSIWEGSRQRQQCPRRAAGADQGARLARGLLRRGRARARPPSRRLAASRRGACARSSRTGDVETVQARARRLVERMALVLQGSLLVRYGDAARSPTPSAPPAWAATRASLGTLHSPGIDFGRIVDATRHRPENFGLHRRLRFHELAEQPDGSIRGGIRGEAVPRRRSPAPTAAPATAAAERAAADRGPEPGHRRADPRRCRSLLRRGGGDRGPVRRATRPTGRRWGSRPRHWLGKLRDWILDNQERILDTMQRETGKVRPTPRNEPVYLADIINFYGTKASKFIGEDARPRPLAAAGLEEAAGPVPAAPGRRHHQPLELPC